MKPLVVNIYVETTPEKTWLLLHNLLKENGFTFYDATPHDPYTSGFNKVESVEEVKQAIERDEK